MPAQRYIRVCSTYGYLLMNWTRVSPTKETRSSVRTPMTEGSHAFDTICERNAVKKLSKPSPIAVSIETHQIQMLVVRIYDAFHESNESMEKLGFVYDDHIIRQQFIEPNVKKIAHSTTRRAMTIVRNYILIVAIPNIARVFDHKNAHTKRIVLRDNGKNAGTLPCEHWT